MPTNDPPPAIRSDLPDAQRLANEFLRVLRRWLPRHKLEQIDVLNMLEPDKRICHSHDFCDSNQAMIDALTALGLEFNGQDDAQHNLINRAWDLAKWAGFSINLKFTPEVIAAFAVRQAEKLLLDSHRHSAPAYTDLPHAYYEESMILVQMPRTPGKSTRSDQWPRRRAPFEQPGTPWRSL